ncbi:sel1 repeat family protein [bacterium]|nr:sel1 repeat family protein [bacterium]
MSTCSVLESAHNQSLPIQKLNWQEQRTQWINQCIQLLIAHEKQNNLHLLEDAKDSHPFTDSEIEIYIQQAHQNRPNSQLILALFHLFAIHHHQSTRKAILWFKRASKSLHPQSFLFLNLLKKELKLSSSQEFENYQRYMDLLEDKKQSHAYVDLQMGIMKLLGEGTSKDELLAIDYLKSAHQKGSDDASYYLSMLYLDGSQTIEVDQKLAVKWLKEAALNDHASASYYLAKIYEEGKLESRDMDAAIQLYQSAAKKNHAKSLYRLSQLYSAGKVLAHDAKKSLQYLQRSADLGELPAIFELAKLYLYGNLRIGKDAHLAKQYLEKASQRNHQESQRLLASLYIELQLYQDAFYWFEKLALEGDTEASYMCAKMLLDGIGIQQNHQSFLFYLKQAALQNHGKACLIYANILFTDAQSQENISLYQDSIYWMMKSAKLNVAQAQYQLAVFYSKGLGTIINKTQAFYWYQRAANQDHIDAHIVLASMLMNGEGHEMDIDKALFHYQEAALQNDADAQIILYKLYSQGDTVDLDQVKAYAWLNILNAYTQEFYPQLQKLQEEMSAKELNRAQKLSLTFLTTIQNKS